MAAHWIGRAARRLVGLVLLMACYMCAVRQKIMTIGRRQEILAGPMMMFCHFLSALNHTSLAVMRCMGLMAVWQSQKCAPIARFPKPSLMRLLKWVYREPMIIMGGFRKVLVILIKQQSAACAVPLPKRFLRR